MKLVYCIDSINHVGGIQKVTISKANTLAAQTDYEVWVIVADNSGDRFFELSPAVHFVNLAVNYYDDDWKSRWNILKGIIVKRRVHKRRLAEHLHIINPDVVIGVGQSEKNILPCIKGDWAKIREYHFARNYRWLLARGLFAKFIAIVGDSTERMFLKKYDKIVLLTYEDWITNWKGTDKIVIIPNPSAFNVDKQSLLADKRIIAVGQLCFQKNFSSLIRSFSIVSKRFPNWKLDIFGDGDEKTLLTRLITDLSLEGNVSLRGNSPQISREMLRSSLFVLSSRIEGWAMVITEAMSCGLPIVSYACPCGPKDIITDEVNGFLVPVGDENMLAERICQLIEDEELRKRMGAAAFDRSRDFDLDKIIQMWMNLFEELIKEKKK